MGRGLSKATKAVNPLAEAASPAAGADASIAFYRPTLSVRTAKAGAELASFKHACQGGEEHVVFSRDGQHARMACSCGAKGPAVRLEGEGR